MEDKIIIIIIMGIVVSGIGRLDIIKMFSLQRSNIIEMSSLGIPNITEISNLLVLDISTIWSSGIRHLSFV